MKITGIIPARFASSRFPGKPLVKIGSKTMIHRVYEQSCKALENVFVATDNIHIRDEVISFGGNCVMTSELHQSGTDRCAEAIKLIDRIQDSSTDVVINIQGDEPFIEPAQIKMLAACFGNKQVDIATLMKPAKNIEEVFNPDKPKVITGINKKAIYFSRSPIPFLRGKEKEQWLHHHAYYMHIGLYAYRKHILEKITVLPRTPLEIAESLEQLRWLENEFHIHVEISDFETISVDTPADLDKILQSGLIQD